MGTTRCYGKVGDRQCPLREDCYRYTYPHAGRDYFGGLPYDAQTNSCELFISNLPTEEEIRTAAYHIWQREDEPEGQAEAYWEQARRECYRSRGRKE